MYEIFIKLLEEKGISTRKLALELGISPSTFTDWKNGRSKPNLDKMVKIADYFGVSVHYLVTGKEKDTNTNFMKEEYLKLISLYESLNDNDKAMIVNLMGRLGENP